MGANICLNKEEDNSLVLNHGKSLGMQGQLSPLLAVTKDPVVGMSMVSNL